MIFSGNGVRRRIIGRRTILNFPRHAPVGFEGAFFVTLQDKRLTIDPGTVNAQVPVIGGVPLTGDKHHPVPFLSFQHPQLDPDGRGFVCLECTFVTPAEADLAAQREQGTLDPWSVKKIEMVQVAYPDSDDGISFPPFSYSGAARALSNGHARWPVAMIRQRASTGGFDLYQIVYHSLRHRAKLKADGRTAARHFFF